MHVNLSINNGIYGVLVETEVKEQINVLGQQMNFQASEYNEEPVLILKQLLKKLNLG